LKETLAEQGLVYVSGEEQRNLFLPSPVGAARPVYLAPYAQAVGNLADKRPMRIVGFSGMRDFYPKLIAENLTKHGVSAQSAILPLSVITTRRDSNCVHLAAALDDVQTQARLAAALKLLAQPGERIGLPAILGLENHTRALAELESTLGASVFEIPTLPPSVPGMRLFLALRRSLASKGARIEANMEAIGFHASGATVEWVETATSARPLKHQAERFLLATGGVLGGGFDSDHTGRIWEKVFGLPLIIPQDRRQWFRPTFFDPYGQPVFCGGVAVNRSFQPINGAGEVVYENLWTAGGDLAHADPIAERSLEGLAIATGAAAAEAMK
jgi:glycerol-3-phosphate dehydrogenase subunit B